MVTASRGGASIIIRRASRFVASAQRRLSYQVREGACHVARTHASCATSGDGSWLAHEDPSPAARVTAHPATQHILLAPAYSTQRRGAYSNAASWETTKAVRTK